MANSVTQHQLKTKRKIRHQPEFQRWKNKIENLLSKPTEMDDVIQPNINMEKNWRKNMEFHLTAMIKRKAEEEKHSVFKLRARERYLQHNSIEQEKTEPNTRSHITEESFPKI